MVELADNTKITLIRIFLLTVCVLVGAAVFQALEGPLQHEEIAKYRNTRKQIVLKYNITDEDARRWGKTYQPNSPPGSEDFLEWSFGNAFMFTMVVVTTIGYGNLVPKTSWGRIFCIGFALVGIPGTCLTLKSIGDKIAEHLSLMITGIEKRCFKIQRPKNTNMKASLLTVVVTLLVFLPLLSYIVYVREPQWSYLECFYFTFTTLTTIGFGDFLPNFRKDVDYLLIIVAFVGLCLISGILCSLNVWLEDYGVSRIVRSFGERNKTRRAHNSTKEDNNTDIQCNREDAAVTNNSHERDTENVQLELRGLSNIDEDLSARENRFSSDAPRKQTKRGSSVSLQLGIFRI